MSGWLWLLTGVTCATVANIFLKNSDGMVILKYGIPGILLGLCSWFAYSMTIKSISLMTAYIVWTGIGTVAIILVGLFLFGETLNLVKGFFMMLVLAGVVGLKLVEGG